MLGLVALLGASVGARVCQGFPGRVPALFAEQRPSQSSRLHVALCIRALDQPECVRPMADRPNHIFTDSQRDDSIIPREEIGAVL